MALWGHSLGGCSLRSPTLGGVGTFGESGSFVLTSAEYKEVLATVLALRRIGSEMADVFSEFAGPGEEATRGAGALVTAADRVLDILYYRGERS